MTAYTVPIGYVLLLKDIRVTQVGATAATYTLAIAAASGGAYAYLAYNQSVTNIVGGWTGWVALNGGDTIGISCPTGQITYWISGALLPFAAALPTSAEALPAFAEPPGGLTVPT